MAQYDDYSVGGEAMRRLLEKLKEPITTIDSTESAAIASLYAAVQGIAQYLAAMGDVTALSVDAENGFSICGQPLMTFGESAPDEAPKAKGCFFYDKTNKVLYVSAAVTGSTSDWQTV